MQQHQVSRRPSLCLYTTSLHVLLSAAGTHIHTRIYIHCTEYARDRDREQIHRALLSAPHHHHPHHHHHVHLHRIALFFIRVRLDWRHQNQCRLSVQRSRVWWTSRGTWARAYRSSSEEGDKVCPYEKSRGCERMSCMRMNRTHALALCVV